MKLLTRSVNITLSLKFIAASLLQNYREMEIYCASDNYDKVLKKLKSVLILLCFSRNVYTTMKLDYAKLSHEAVIHIHTFVHDISLV